LISEGLWTRHFGNDANVIGRAISLSSDPYVVIGVVSSDFNFEEFGPSLEVWTPFQIDPQTTDHGHYFSVTGRLKSVVTLEQANAQLGISANEFRGRFPDALSVESGFGVERLQEVLVRNARTSLFVLVGAVGFVLLIACANVANLLLVRATGRKREIAIRAPIESSRGRIIRQLLTESVLLSTIGGALGLVLGMLGIRALLAINTAGLPRLGQDGSLVSMDWRVVGFTILASTFTGLVFGLIPALALAFGPSFVIASLLFRVQAHDPVVFVGIPVLFGLIALIAVWLPARRASRVGPISALRYE
jgi:putative ABC transport system permease protein